MLCLTFDEYYRVPVVLTYMQFSIHVNGDIFTVFFLGQYPGSHICTFCVPFSESISLMIGL